MNWYSIFYWFSVVDNLSTFAVVIASILTAIGFIAFLFKIFTNPDSHYPDGKLVIGRSASIFKWCGIIAPIFWLIFLFLPTKKQMLMIVAGGTVGEFIKGDTSVRQLPTDVTRYLHLSMKKEIENLSIETKEELGVATPKESFLNKVKDMTKEEIIEKIKTDSTLLK